jgi:integrase
VALGERNAFAVRNSAMSVRVRKSRNGKGWEVDVLVRTPDGRRRRERVDAPVSSKSAARRWGEQREHQLALHGRPKKREVPTVDEFGPRYIVEYAEANRQKPSTIIQKKRIIEHYLSPRIGKKKLDQVNDSDVQKLKSDLLHLSPKTTNNALVCLNTMLKCALDWDVIDRMPCHIKLLKIPRILEPKFYEPHEYERLVEAARKLDPRIELFVLLGGDGGLRCGEIIALEQTDVDLKRGYLVVRRSEWEGHLTVPKSGRERKVMLTERLKAALTRNRHMRGDPGALARRRFPEGESGAAREVDVPRAAARRTQGHRRDPHPASHVLLSARHGWRFHEGHPGARRPRADLDDAAVHAPLAGGEVGGHLTAGSARGPERGGLGHGGDVPPWSAWSRRGRREGPKNRNPVIP